MSKKSLLVSAMGVLTGFGTAFAAAFKKRGGTDEELHQFLVGNKSDDFISQIADLAMKMVGRATAPFPVFKTVTLGVHDSVKAYRKALNEAGFRISDWASDILNKIKLSQNQVQLDLIRISGADLGFKEAVRYDQICAKAKELGLELCPAEVGPALRLAYPDQPYGDWLRIAMESISDSGGYLWIFGVFRGDVDRWLGAGYGGPDGLWGPGDVWVFVLPRK